MSSHYDFALRAAKGEWIQALGADDSVLPWYFEIADKIVNRFPNMNIITWNRSYFFWPDCQKVYDNRCLEFEFEHKITKKNFKFNFYLCIYGFKSLVGLPQIYTGSLIRKSIIDEIRDISYGKFYYSIIPDVYSTIAIMCKENKYLQVNIPLTLIGTSGNTMHQGNRIYSDSYISNENICDFNSKLHSTILKDFHKLGLEPIYLLECTRSIPTSLKFSSKSFLTFSCYLSLFASFIRNDKQIRMSRKIFWRQFFDDPEFSNFQLILCLILSPILVLMQIFFTAQNMIFTKLRLIFKQKNDGFQSDDRVRFRNTYEAANYLSIFTDFLLNKRFKC